MCWLSPLEARNRCFLVTIPTHPMGFLALSGADLYLSRLLRLALFCVVLAVCRSATLHTRVTVVAVLH